MLPGNHRNRQASRQARPGRMNTDIPIHEANEVTQPQNGRQIPRPSQARKAGRTAQPEQLDKEQGDTPPHSSLSAGSRGSAVRSIIPARHHARIDQVTKMAQDFRGLPGLLTPRQPQPGGRPRGQEKDEPQAHDW